MTTKSKQQAHEDFKRDVLIHICKDGTFSYRKRNEPIFNTVALPVFSVDTVKEAKQLQIHFCKLQYQPHPLMPDKPWYVWPDFSGEVGELTIINKKLRDQYKKMKDQKHGN